MRELDSARLCVYLWNDPTNMGTSPDLRNVMQGVIDDSKSLGYTLPGEPLSRHKNLEAASKLRGAALVNKEEL